MALFTFDHDDAHVGVHAQSPTPGIKRVDTLADATDNMDIDGGKPLLVQAICGTPPITISSPMPKRQVEPQKLLGPEKLDFDQVMRKAKKNKKKKRAMKNGAPAANTIRGFQTPVTSGGEESDFASVTSTPRFGPTSGMHSITSSPALRPASGMGGISNLKQQLEALNIGPKLDSPLLTDSRMARSVFVCSTSFLWTVKEALRNCFCAYRRPVVRCLTRRTVP
jgi:serine/threonine-protein kinase Psk1